MLGDDGSVRLERISTGALSLVKPDPQNPEKWFYIQSDFSDDVLTIPFEIKYDSTNWETEECDRWPDGFLLREAQFVRMAPFVGGRNQLWRFDGKRIVSALDPNFVLTAVSDGFRAALSGPARKRADNAGEFLVIAPKDANNIHQNWTHSQGSVLTNEGTKKVLAVLENEKDEKDAGKLAELVRLLDASSGDEKQRWSRHEHAGRDVCFRWKLGSGKIETVKNFASWLTTAQIDGRPEGVRFGAKEERLFLEFKIKGTWKAPSQYKDTLNENFTDMAPVHFPEGWTIRSAGLGNCHNRWLLVADVEKDGKKRKIKRIARGPDWDADGNRMGYKEFFRNHDIPYMASNEELVAADNEEVVGVGFMRWGGLIRPYLLVALK